MILLMLCLFFNTTDSTITLRDFDVTKNCNLTKLILLNPDTLSALTTDSNIYYRVNQEQSAVELINDKIMYIKNHFNNGNIIVLSNISILPSYGFKQDFLYYANIISYKNLSNNYQIDFTFIELDKGIWKLKSINKYIPSEWPVERRRK